MAIRLRVVNGTLIAICAARSVAKAGDVYLDDGQHHALASKFARDFSESFDLGWEINAGELALVEQEESNNPNRENWDRVFGSENKPKLAPPPKPKQDPGYIRVPRPSGKK